MISHRYKCVFFHQRKCAGMSIMKTFNVEPDTPNWIYLNDGALDLETCLVPKGYFIFSVVRNPWDRFISGWKFCESTKHLSLEQALRNLPTSGKDYRHLTRPQYKILYDSTGRLIPHYLIRFENLQADYDRVCKQLGKPQRTLPFINKGSRSGYRDYFDSTTRSLFYEHFREDITRFGYNF